MPIDNTEVTDFKIGRIGTNGIIGDFIARVLHVAILLRVDATRPRVPGLDDESFVAPNGGGRILVLGLRPTTGFSDPHCCVKAPIQNPSARI